MSKIEWTQKTWNPITGCTKRSEGCKHCYAEKMHNRLAAMGQRKYQNYFNDISDIRFYPEELKRNFGKNPKMIFVNSMSDTFHEGVENDWIKKILETIAINNQHTFQLLTKRASRLEFFNYPKNAWVGVTVENAIYKSRIDYLRKTNANIKFLSCEPLIGDLGELDLTGIDWVICGGESGHNARPCHPDWVRNIQRQCQEQNVPFFFKQWGEWCQGSQLDYNVAIENFNVSDGVLLNVQVDMKTCSYKVGKKNAGSLLDGKQYKEYPPRYIIGGVDLAKGKDCCVINGKIQA